MIGSPLRGYLGDKGLRRGVGVELVGVPFCDDGVAGRDGFEIEGYGAGEAEGTDETPGTDRV